ncbi:MAG: hypothetical protein HKN70_07335, partial [Gammaproteobacteria bacterium]|nr:hypothetical protein [Gammaproteobacteria bacterium]
MKHITRLILISLGLMIASVQASAAILAFDNFDYADGSLVPNGGWATHSGTAGDLLVSGGQVVVQHGTPSEDANIEFTGVAGDIYYGLDFTVNASGMIIGTDNEYFAHFRVADSFDFSARLDVVSATSGGDFTVGIASDDSTADAIWGTDLDFGVTYRAVVKYDQVNNIATLWIDALFASDTSIVGDDRADPGDMVNSFALRQSDSDLNETVLVDNLVIGSTFDDVVRGASPIPVPAAIWLFASALGLLGFKGRKA